MAVPNRFKTEEFIMSNIKETSTRPEVSPLAGKDIQLAKQQMELQAGQTVIRETAKALKEQNKQIEQEQTTDDRTENDTAKDTSEISEIHHWPGADKTTAADAASKWCLEMDSKNWNALLEWTPTPGADLPEQIQELSKLYLALLESILKYTEGEWQAMQLEQLDTLLAEKLQLLMDADLDEVARLLEETGQDAALDGIKSSMYQQTTGQSISARAANALFTRARRFSMGSGFDFIGNTSARGVQGRGDSSSNSGFRASSNSGFKASSDSGFRAGSASRSFSSSSASVSRFSSGEGQIYNRAGENSLRFQQANAAGQKNWKAQIRQRTEVINNARNGITGNSLSRSASVSYSGRELAQANRFAAHINGSGNLFKNPRISARNEEVTGLMAALMTIKGRIFAAGAGRGNAITLPLQNAIDKLIDQYLRQKGASRVYYYTISAYEKQKNPEQAMKDGQAYAYQQFKEKQENPAWQKSPHYSRQAGFFQTLSKNQSPEKDLALGFNVLQKDWQNFLHVLGKGGGFSYRLEAERYSPWGAAAGSGKSHTDSDEHIGKILLAAAAILVGVGVVYFWVL